MILCTRCKISKAFKGIESKRHLYDLKEVDNTDKNDTLYKIIINLKKNSKIFTIESYHNKYRIKLLKKIGNAYLLTQTYLHFDKKNGLIPVSTR